MSGDERPDELGSAKTLAQEAASELDSLPRVRPGGSAALAGEQRYRDRKLLGEGGMGVVRLVRDGWIGRDVAHKTMHAQESRSAIERFVREARVQAQLEHPAIVPVYDLGSDPEGRLYFTMKRVRGRSLDAIVGASAAGDAETLEAFPRRRLLGAFVQVCLAVEYAHTRGVLHRDLKPANVMLGAFGEVHVLDWGLARVRDVDDPVRDDGTSSLELPERVSGDTMDGAVLGTPGYMAPVQAHGKLDASDERADVYSLGAILFEILFLEPLHGQKSAMERLTQTVQGPSPPLRERARFDAVPPELCALIERAIAIDPEQRPRRARELADAVERYLAGERDAERRDELASAHVEAAQAHVARGEVTDALRELGRALALVPTNAAALAALEGVLTRVPESVPDEARAELDAMQRARATAAVRTTAIRALTWLLAVPAVIAFGVVDWSRGALVLVTLLTTAALATIAWRSESVSRGWMIAIGVASSCALATFSFLLGPFVVVPGLVSTNAMFLAMSTERRLRWVWLALGAAAMTVPFVLMLAGIDPHYTSLGDVLEIRSTITHLPIEGTLAFLFVTSLATLITPTVLAGRMRDRLVKAEERVFLQAWHLRHLLPR